MYLKSLTLKGFKTFADRTDIAFDPSGGIIAVVGPNGCGKSNVVDAIRWVLGEQSLREIRSTAMEDIIFAGTAQRKPLSMAEVTLEIDNSDKFFHSEYTEVSIRRRVFRSGESEFFINKNPCRLKDIKDLFLDTGLGKGAYSIINQGQVDAILSSKPDERRAPFEEAAQISKYRFRKEAAERKLIATEQNLLRINDLRNELSSQIKVLEVQAEKARKYREIKSVLKELEIGLTKKQLQSLNERRSSQGSRVDQLRLELEAAENRFGELERQRQSLKDEVAGVESEMEAALASIEQNLSAISKHKMDLEIEQERERSLSEQLELSRKEIDELLPRLKEYGEKLAEKQSHQRDSQALLDAKEADLSALKERLASQSGEEESQNARIEALKSSTLEAERAISGDRNTMSDLEGNERFAREELARDRRSTEKLKADLASTQDVLRSTTAAREAEESALAGLDRLIEENSGIRKGLEADASAGEKALFSVKEDLSTRASKLSVLRSLLEEHKGFGEGVREIIKLTKASQRDFGILGVVADLMEVEEKFELAIETALGPNIQVLIARTDEAAKDLIGHLRKENLGKASFLPLNLLRAAERPDLGPIASQPGFIGTASSLVKAGPEIAPAMEFLLGNILVLDSLENALKLYKRNLLPKGARIVTLGGESLTYGGMLSGGAPMRRAAMHLGRERELLALQGEIDGLRAEAEKLEAGLSATRKKIDQLGSSISKLTQDKHNVLIKLEGIRHDEEARAESAESLKEELSLLAKGIAARESEINEVNASKTEISKRIGSLEKARAEQENSLKDLLHASKQSAVASAELSGRITEARIETSRLQHQKRALDEEISIISENITRIEETIRQKEGLDLGTKLDLSRQAISKIRESLPKLEAAQAELESGLKGKKETKVSLSQKFESMDKENQEAALRERDLRDKLSKEEVSSAKIEAEMNLISQSVIEDYEITIDDILSSAYEVPNQAKAKDEIRGLKDELKKLGDVNLLAIEEFEKTGERLSFLEVQVGDLDQARTNLRSLISQLDQKARENFIETIRVVSENFSKIFADLFEGGEAKIMLIESEDILDAGIEIVARPGGKKWLSLDLLSGGEKALTAIAILFSLLRTHPSPFCFLDEVDAALDDSNIGRFTKMLTKFADDTQMIVITHSKRTMESAKILYGVTMEEPGVSKLVSMKLSEVPQTLKQ